MYKFFLNLYKTFIPTSIQNRIALSRESSENRTLRETILRYYESTNNNHTAEVSEVVAYLKKHPLVVIPYKFRHEYANLNVKVLYDEQEHLPFVYLGRNRLYFRKDWNDKQIEQIFKSLLIEQDARSPHRYLTADFDVTEKDIIADVGAAEGIFTLSVIEKVKKAYLFEADEQWIKPLSATFRPWRDKVTIVNKYVSDSDDLNKISLDSYFNNEEVDLLKIDIEGGEFTLLKGSEHLMKKKNLKVAICTYHQQHDAEELGNYFKEKGFNIHFSRGYMIYFYNNDLAEPYLRKALLRASKNGINIPSAKR